MYLTHLQYISAVPQNGVCANIPVSKQWVKAQATETVSTLVNDFVTSCLFKFGSEMGWWCEKWRQIDVAV